MRVLLTRAAEDAARTRAKLEAAGYGVVVSPVIEIVATEASWPTGVIDALLATSAQAFQMIDGAFGPSPEARRLTPLFLVGERTAERARDAGFRGAALVAANATELALRLGAMPHKPSRLVYLAGRDRKPDLEAAVAITHQAIEILEVYEAQAVETLDERAFDALHARSIDAILHFSRRSAVIFCELAEAHGVDATAPRHVCLSDDVAAPLRDQGLPRIEVAGAPTEAALLELLG